MNEFKLIEKYFKPLNNSKKEAQEFLDDVAKISFKKDEELVISKDVFVQDVHFLLSDGAFKIASKLLRVNLSDLASSGAKPLYYMLGFSKNKKTDEKFISEFVQGLKSIQDEFGLSLIGGDTVFSKTLFFSVTIFGVVKKGKNLLRKNAKEGDLIFVSGSIGDAKIGLDAVLKKDSSVNPYFLNRHFFPTPRINLGQELAKKNLSKCAIDVSDGLLADLSHICKASNLTAKIFLEKIPVPNKSLDLLVSGDDYELIFTTPKKNLEKIKKLSKALKLDLTCIGDMQKKQKEQVILLDSKNKKIPIKKFGYEHN